MTAECANEPLDHDKRMSSVQVWTYTEVEHMQGLDITSLYLVNTGNGGSWVRGRRGHGLAVGKGENLLWDSCSGSFEGNILLGQHTIQKK